MILTYFKAFISGDLDSVRTHLVLLSVAILAEFAVAVGIMLESPKEKSRREIVGMILVLGGVSISAVFTIGLFVFDEGISSTQQSKIIALEKRLAPRTLEMEDRKLLVQTLQDWATIPDTSIKRKVLFIPYSHATHESQTFQDELAETFRVAGWDASNAPLHSMQDAFNGVQFRAGSPIYSTAQEAAKFLSIAIKPYGPTDLLPNSVNLGCERPEYKIDPACRRLQITVGEYP